MSALRKRSHVVDPEELLHKADESLKKTRAQQPRVTFITSWLEKRKDENGFGTDFEYTLKPKEVS